MSSSSTRSRYVVSSISGYACFAATARKIVTNRSVAIIGLTGLASLIGGFRLATQGSAEGEEMFRAWMIAWLIVWFALAGVCLRLLKPMYDFFVTDQIALLDSYQLKQMRRLQPSFDQELRSLGLYQQLRDERAADAATFDIDNRATMGGLSVGQGAGVDKELPQRSRIVTNA